jgi:hypothetical protein
VLVNLTQIPQPIKVLTVKQQPKPTSNLEYQWNRQDNIQLKQTIVNNFQLQKVKKFPIFTEVNFQQ